ncbi:hypothetical protein BD779DRAFT_1082210 [Infundibulicybe gibba]|nr:hypothetical protein BD779DRAFT_1082210 [Infundibulicybe gibba]
MKMDLCILSTKNMFPSPTSKEGYTPQRQQEPDTRRNIHQAIVAIFGRDVCIPAIDRSNIVHEYGMSRDNQHS